MLGKTIAKKPPTITEIEAVAIGIYESEARYMMERNRREMAAEYFLMVPPYLSWHQADPAQRRYSRLAAMDMLAESAKDGFGG